MTSFVEFHGHGFWCRNVVLAAWLREVVALAGPRQAAWPWLRPAAMFWEAAASALKSRRTDVRLQSDVNTPEKQRQCEELFEIVSFRPLPPAEHRCALLALALIRGELPGTRTAVEFWSLDEWSVT